MNAVDLLSSSSMGDSPSPLATTERTLYNRSEVPDELFAQCCLSKKCMCKTCYIPDCDSDAGEVVVELQPESMDTPGQCCGKYECRQQPNCSEVWDTEFYWLQSCQRCLCNSGASICQQSCDEGTNAICESKNQNTFFKDGESWVDGCYQCECVKGEPKCVIPFCGHVNCPSERQVQLKDSCCPVCWPKGEPMPHEKSSSYDDGYGYESEEQRKSQQLQRQREEDHMDALEATVATTPTTPTTITTISSSSSISSPQQAEPINYSSSNSGSRSTATTAQPRCQLHDYPKVVEVVHEDTFQIHLYQFIICLLVVIVVFEFCYIKRLLAKQRSYRPVSNFDDKV